MVIIEDVKMLKNNFNINNHSHNKYEQLSNKVCPLHEPSMANILCIWRCCYSFEISREHFMLKIYNP